MRHICHESVADAHAASLIISLIGSTHPHAYAVCSRGREGVSEGVRNSLLTGADGSACKTSLDTGGRAKVLFGIRARDVIAPGARLAIAAADEASVVA